MKIISNNPLVQEKYSSQTEYINSNVYDVLINARNHIHLGAELLNHPLSGNLSFSENPYKSLVLKENDTHTAMTTNFYSLTIIENAIAQTTTPAAHSEKYDEKTLKDYQIIDLDMLKNCADKFI